MHSYLTVAPLLFLVVLFLVHPSHPLSVAGPLSSREDLVMARQARIKRSDTDTTDTCANVFGELEVRPHGFGLPVDVGVIKACLCKADVPSFLATNPVTEHGVALAGTAEVETALDALIESSPSKRVCNYPAHAVPKCTSEDPCDFTCSDNYTPYTPFGKSAPTDCRCNFPWKVCNGQCGSFPHGCGSAVPKGKKPKRSTMLGVSMCDVGLEVCGVPGSVNGRRGWECVNTTSDLESCGGCLLASAFSPHDAPKTGTDCSAIAHVDEVRCRNGQCSVSSCLAGFSPSVSKNACVPVSQDAEWDHGFVIHSNDGALRLDD